MLLYVAEMMELREREREDERGCSRKWKNDNSRNDDWALTLNGIERICDHIINQSH